MNKLDQFLLHLSHRVSNWTYKTVGADNYTIATCILLISMITSIALGIQTHTLALQESNPEIARIRDNGAVAGAILSTSIALLVLATRKHIAQFLTQRRDLGKKDRIAWAGGVFARWSVLLLFLGFLPFQMRWYGMLDFMLINIAGWFLACDPPDMNLRMKREFGGQEW